MDILDRIVHLTGVEFPLIFIATVGWYAATGIAMTALSGGQLLPGRRAIAHTACTATLVLGALWFDQTDTAIAIIFATSVACLTLVLGLVTVMGHSTEPPIPQRSWAFLVPVALIALMAGFSGMIGPTQIVVLFLEGLALLMFWIAPATSTSPEDPPAKLSRPRVFLFGLALIAATVASIAGLLASRSFSDKFGLPRTYLSTALMLGPALVLSLIGWGTAAARDGHYNKVVATLVGCVMLNLCALLPLAATVWAIKPYAKAGVYWVARLHPGPTTTIAATEPSSQPSFADEHPFMTYPMSIWRIDTVLLLALGLFLLPVAMGKWTLGPGEGFVLVLVYLVYMVLTTSMAR